MKLLERIRSADQNKELTVLVQCRVDRALVEKAKAIMNQENASWKDLITAAILQLLEEDKHK